MTSKTRNFKSSEVFQSRYLTDIEYAQRFESLMDSVGRGDRAEFKNFVDFGNYLLGEGAWEAARLAYAKGIEKGEASVLLWNNIGFAFETEGLSDSAIECYELALRNDPDFALARGNLHSCLVKRALVYFGIDDEPSLKLCESWLYRALSVNPSSGWATMNLGNVAMRRNQPDLAEFWYRQSIRFEQNPATVKNNLAHLLLRQERLKEGFELYESRRHSGGYPSGHAFFPEDRYWDGHSDLNGRCLYLHWEQGFGDMIQYVRYCYLLRQRYPSARIILDTMPELVPFFKQLEKGAERGHFEDPVLKEGPVDNVIANDDRSAWVEQADLVFPVMSLAKVFTDSVATIFAPTRYFSPMPGNPDLQMMLAGIEKGKPTIGVLWAGRPTHGNDKHRSIHLSSLQWTVEHLLLKGCVVISLQMGDAAKQVEECGFKGRILEVGSHIRDFRDTSTVLSRLDHYITVDSANLHLAGALGVPATALIPVRSDFRWFENRVDSPWYPSVRVFRQKEEGHWRKQLQEGLFSMVVARLVSLGFQM